ncbi:hypothetical protein [Rhodococcoides kyotonense]|uniref:Acetoacetate decarboxylase (ADC) n=1 Tax=Rhodococcoides kyotonense TaxID=398843 RepID=A0A239F4M1_9NOCA|nr:hypothetical protein [Rhodococcus kyotonensis]SNS51787.1 hypothetical protein SAMN05421642_103108 [Rhodococcus kyotonensis]
MWSVMESEADHGEWPDSPPPPWPADVRATIWWHRATRSGRELVPEKSVPITIVMVVDYLTSPVGPYREILASPTFRRPGGGLGAFPRMSVPFIAVDSARSVHGGRTHWHLPKVLATFDGDVLGESRAATQEWSVDAAARPIGPAFPIRGGVGFAQPVDDEFQVAGSTLSGKAKLCRVKVGAQGPTLGSWLKSGTYPGLQIVSGRMSTGTSRLVSPRE